MKLLFWLGGPILLFLVIILGLSIFLSPNDLAKCNNMPGNQQACQKADVIVAISGGDTMARAKSAIELYQKGWADTIIFSGAAADPNSPSNAAVMRNQAVRAGVPRSAIILDEEARSTEENARNVAIILAENDWNDVILTTSPYHLRRSKILFQSASPDAQIRTASATDSRWDSLWFLSPRGWWLAISEFGGIIKFWLGGSRI